MSVIESTIKGAAKALGIPIFATVVTVTSLANKGLEVASNAAMSASADIQMMPEENHLTKKLSTHLLLTEKMKYGEDYAYFTLNSYDGALKKLDSSGSGDLYMIDSDGFIYFVFAKNGLVGIQELKTIKIISSLSKRGGPIDVDRVEAFLKPMVNELIEQEKRINKLKASGMMP
ncbi:hypothetical protein ACI7BZ_06125 [Xanthobacter sp. AM11]|uniref:hypothetical protein n=1 Tax=Xanthobacter sp. AM11 TaxID=3380643 RepID=UPI0039BEDF50